MTGAKRFFLIFILFYFSILAMLLASSEREIFPNLSSFWEQTLRRKKSSSWKVQEMKMLLQLRGLDTKGSKLVVQNKVKALLYPADSAAVVDTNGACGSEGSTMSTSPPSSVAN